MSEDWVKRGLALMAEYTDGIADLYWKHVTLGEDCSEELDKHLRALQDHVVLMAAMSAKMKAEERSVYSRLLMRFGVVEKKVIDTLGGY